MKNYDRHNYHRNVYHEYYVLSDFGKFINEDVRVC